MEMTVAWKRSIATTATSASVTQPGRTRHADQVMDTDSEVEVELTPGMPVASEALVFYFNSASKRLETNTVMIQRKRIFAFDLGVL